MSGFSFLSWGFRRVAAARPARNLMPALCAGITLLSWSQAHAADGTWITNASSTWSNSANWTGGTIADGVGAIATFSTLDLTAGTRTVTIDTTSRTLGTLLIGDSNTGDLRAYVIAASGGAGLIFDNGASNAVLTQTANSAGDTISARVVLNSSLNITNSSTTATRVLTPSTGGISAGTAGTKTLSILGSTAGGVTFSGPITDGAGVIAIVKGNANNALTLSGTNTYTGGVTLNAGTLNLNSGTALGATVSTLTITGGTLASTAGSATTIGNNNAMNWDGNFSFGGTQSLNTGSGAVTLSGNRTVSVSGSGTYTVGGVIDDGGSGFTLTTANGASGLITGTLVLSGANTYTGGTNINGGLVRFNSAAAIPATGTITIGTDGALSVSGAYTTLAAWMADPRLSTASTGALSLAINSAENFNPGAVGFNTLSLGANVGTTATYFGTYTAAGGTYYAGGGGGTIIFTNTNAFTGAGNLVAGNGGGGTVVLAGDNDYTGTTTINKGTLQVGNGSTVGTLGNATSTVTNNGTLAFNRTDAFTFDRVITGTGILIQRGTGTLLLTAASTFTGSTTVNAGTVEIGITNALPTTTAVTLGTGSVAGNLTLNNFDQSVASLAITTTAAAPNNTVTIAAGRTLTVTGTGSFVVGVANTVGITTNATITGAGSFVVNNASGNLEVGLANNDQNGTTNMASLNMANLGSFTANVNEFRVGHGSRIGSTLTLSNTSNTITANTLQLANSLQLNGTESTIILGTGTNVINANTINIGLSKIGGVFKFASQAAGSAGTVTINGKAGAGSNATIIVGGNTNVSTASVFASTMDLRGHVSNVSAAVLTIGTWTQTGNGGVTGTVHFDTGTFTATSVVMGNKTNSGSGTSAGILNISGGTFTVTGSGNITLSSHSGSAGAATATMNVSGGVVTVGGNIVRTMTGTGSAAGLGTLNLSGGVLDMTAGTIGAAAANNTIAFNFTGGTLQNVAEVNGGGLVTKSGSGVGVLAGTNTYTGGTAVTGGSLLVNGSVTGAATVSSGANLGGNGSIAGAVTMDGNLRTGGVVATADTYGVGVLTASSLAFGATSTDNRFEANANGFNASALNGDGSVNTAYISNTANRTTGTTDQLQITNQLDIGTNDGVNFSFALSGYTAQIGDAFDLLDWATLVGGGFGNFNYGTEGVLRSGGISEAALYDLDLPELQAGYFWNIDAFNETGVIVVVGLVPEPSRVFLMLGAGMMMILRRRGARVA